MNGDEGDPRTNHRDNVANDWDESITSRIAEAGGVNATSARSAERALPYSSSSGNTMEAPSSFPPHAETSRCAFHPSKSALFHRPARGDGSRSRSDSLVVHAESEEENYAAGPFLKLAQQELAQQMLPPPSASMNSTTSGSSNAQQHPKFAQLPEGLRDKPRPPQTRHRRFANQLKRKLRELESAVQPNGDSRIELALKAPPSSLHHHASNQAYDADTEDEGESFPSAARSSGKQRAHADHKQHGGGYETNRGAAKRSRSSALSPRIDSLMPDVASKNSEKL